MARDFVVGEPRQERSNQCQRQQPRLRFARLPVFLLFILTCGLWNLLRLLRFHYTEHGSGGGGGGGSAAEKESALVASSSSYLSSLLIRPRWSSTATTTTTTTTALREPLQQHLVLLQVHVLLVTVNWASVRQLIASLLLAMENCDSATSNNDSNNNNQIMKSVQIILHLALPRYQMSYTQRFLHAAAACRRSISVRNHTTSNNNDNQNNDDKNTTNNKDCQMSNDKTFFGRGNSSTTATTLIPRLFLQVMQWPKNVHVELLALEDLEQQTHMQQRRRQRQQYPEEVPLWSLPDMIQLWAQQSTYSLFMDPQVIVAATDKNRDKNNTPSFAAQVIHAIQSAPDGFVYWDPVCGDGDPSAGRIFHPRVLGFHRNSSQLMKKGGRGLNTTSKKWGMDNKPLSHVTFAHSIRVDEVANATTCQDMAALGLDTLPRSFRANTILTLQLAPSSPAIGDNHYNDDNNGWNLYLDINNHTENHLLTVSNNCTNDPNSKSDSHKLCTVFRFLIKEHKRANAVDMRAGQRITEKDRIVLRAGYDASYGFFAPANAALKRTTLPISVKSVASTNETELVFRLQLMVTITRPDTFHHTESFYLMLADRESTRLFWNSTSHQMELSTLPAPKNMTTTTMAIFLFKGHASDRYVGLAPELFNHSQRPNATMVANLVENFLPRNDHMRTHEKPMSIVTRIALLVPVISTKERYIFQTPFVTKFLRSLKDSIAPRSSIGNNGRNFHFEIYVGFDEGDRLFDHVENQRQLQALVHNINVTGHNNLTVTFVRHRGTKGAPCWIWNNLALMAYENGCDYFYQLNDDAKFLSNNWAPLLIAPLEQNPIRAGLGVSGPKDPIHYRLFTQALVSRLHLEIFNSFYPPVFKNWYSDDWLTQVYVSLQSQFAVHNVLVKNDGVTRYAVEHRHKHILWSEIAEGRSMIQLFLDQRNKTIEKHGVFG